MWKPANRRVQGRGRGGGRAQILNDEVNAKVKVRSTHYEGKKGDKKGEGVGVNFKLISL